MFMMAYHALWGFMMAYHAFTLCFYDGAWCFMMTYHAFMMVLDVLWWLIMLYDGVWCFMLVCVWCFMLVYDGVWWCMIVFHGLSWCTMMYDGLSWFMIIYHGYLWFMVYPLISWNSWLISFIMDIHGLSLFIMVYAVYDVSYCWGCMMVCRGLSWVMVVWSYLHGAWHDHVWKDSLKIFFLDKNLCV